LLGEELTIDVLQESRLALAVFTEEPYDATLR